MFIGVPEKGRNAGMALREELPPGYDVDFLLDVLNGGGKNFARRGADINWVAEAVAELDCVEFRDTGSPFPRPIFTQIQLDGKLITSYEENPLEKDFDRFYQGLDQIVEEDCSVNRICEKSFEDLAKEIAEEENYLLEDFYGKEVKWGVMNTDLDAEPEAVLMPENFPNLGIAAVDKYWDKIPKYLRFEDYTGGNGIDTWDEEEILANTSEEVAGVYMFVSGKTAEDAGLEYEALPGFNSRLGRFEVMENE